METGINLLLGNNSPALCPRPIIRPSLSRSGSFIELADLAARQPLQSIAETSEAETVPNEQEEETVTISPGKDVKTAKHKTAKHVH